MRMLRKSLLIWLALLPLIALSLLPFAVMFLTAVKPKTEMFDPSWFPSHFEWSNFVLMWQETGFGRALWNSLYISTLATAISVLVAIPAGYALSRYRFRGRSFFQNFLLVSQMLSPIVLVLGLFRLMVLMGVLGRPEALAFLYAGFNIAFSIWMLESYFATIPRDLEESAWMEGSSALTAIRRVFLPLALPAIAVTALFTFINSWNEFALALTMLRDDASYTLPVLILSLVMGRYGVDWHYVMAAALVATVPIAVILAWTQNFMVQGMTAGAVK
ncbi:MAG: carbohydrate ABC transporter permease [Devosia sp.]